MQAATSLRATRFFSIALLGTIVLAIALKAPAVFVEFSHDDFCIIHAIKGVPSTHSAHHKLDLFRWFDGDPEDAEARMALGTRPWHFDREQNLGHFRPVSSALMCLDYYVFGREARGAHVHSLLWLVFLILAAALVYRQVLQPRHARLALLIFAISPVFTTPLEWWVGRYALVIATFGFLGLWAHLKWREHGWRPGAIVSPLLFGVCLLSGESAVQCLGYLAAYALLGDRASLPSRMASLVAPTVLFVVYIVIYKIMGYAVERSIFYVDPFHETGAFLQNTTKIIPAAISKLLVPFRYDGTVLIVIYRAALAVALLVFAIAFRSKMAADPNRPRGTSWLLAGTFFALLPASASVDLRPQTLVIPSLGVAAFFAAVLQQGWAIIRSRTESTGAVRIATAMLCAALVVTMALATLASSRNLVSLTRLPDEEDAFISTVSLDPAVRTIVVLRADKFWPLGTYLRTPGGANLEATLTLAVGDVPPCTLTRTGPTSLMLEVETGSLTPTNDGWRSGQFPITDDDIILETMRIRNLETIDGQVRRAEFEFNRPLDDPSFAFFVHSGSSFLPVELPPVGGTTLLE